MKQSLGLVEIIGLPTAVLVADTMVKAANVQIIEMENSKGLGYMTIKIQGDVGAVKASVDAGCQIGRTYGKLAGWKVIARPSDYVEQTFCSSKGVVPPVPPTPPAPVMCAEESAADNETDEKAGVNIEAEEPEGQLNFQPETENQETAAKADTEAQEMPESAKENAESPVMAEEPKQPVNKPSAVVSKKASKKTNHNKDSI